MNWRKQVDKKIKTGSSWPSPKVSEELAEWIERCFFAKPQYRDGSPVVFDEFAIGDSADDNGIRFGDVRSVEYKSTGDVVVRLCCGNNISEAKVWEGGKCFERRNVVDADGVPIIPGDTVYIIGSEAEYVVDCVSRDDMTCELHPTLDDGMTVKLEARTLTHEVRDTQDKIDADAVLTAHEYLRKCPSALEYHAVGAKKNRYTERQAMVLDLLRRQRALCERGAE